MTVQSWPARLDFRPRSWFNTASLKTLCGTEQNGTTQNLHAAFQGIAGTHMLPNAVNGKLTIGPHMWAWYHMRITSGCMGEKKEPHSVM